MQEPGKDSGEGGQCAYMDKILPVVLLATRQTVVQQWAREQFDIDASDYKMYFQWLGGQQRFYRMKGTNAHVM